MTVDQVIGNGEILRPLCHTITIRLGHRSGTNLLLLRVQLHFTRDTVMRVLLHLYHNQENQSAMSRSILNQYHLSSRLKHWHHSSLNPNLLSRQHPYLPHQAGLMKWPLSSLSV